MTAPIDAILELNVPQPIVFRGDIRKESAAQV